MSENRAPQIPKWPFLLADVVFLVLAAAVVNYGFERWQWWQAAFAVVSTLAGGWLCVLPFLREHEAAVKFAESNQLVTTVETIRNVESVAAQVSGVSNQLQSVLDQSGKTVAAAEGIAKRMTEEARAFSEFMQKANDTEKSHLRLEVEKLRRSEGEWLQVLVRQLDNVFALYQAASRSGQQPLIDQIGLFQGACRDAARRVGLVPLAAAPGEAFNPQAHQLVEGQTLPEEPGPVAETLATGYTFQGRLIRPVLVRLQDTTVAPTALAETDAEATEPAPGQPQLL